MLEIGQMKHFPSLGLRDITQSTNNLLSLKYKKRCSHMTGVWPDLSNLSLGRLGTDMNKHCRGQNDLTTTRAVRQQSQFAHGEDCWF